MRKSSMRVLAIFMVWVLSINFFTIANVQQVEAGIFDSFFESLSKYEFKKYSGFGSWFDTATATPTPTVAATEEPVVEVTITPTIEPTIEATVVPTVEPTVAPTVAPTVEPTAEATVVPTVEPTVEPTVVPTVEPTVEASVAPTAEPTVVPTSEPVVSDKIFNMTAAEVVKDMGLGWNLGCSLDSFNTNADVTMPNTYTGEDTSDESVSTEVDTEETEDVQENTVTQIETVEYNKQYQVMVVYSTESYSGWDVSSTPFMDSNNEINLSWNMTTLNSSLDGACGYFAIQIINNDLKNSGDNYVVYDITNLSVTKANGDVVSLSDVQKTYSTKITNGVGDYVFANLYDNTELLTTNDLIGAELKLNIKFTDFPDKVVTYTEVSSSVDETETTTTDTTDDSTSCNTIETELFWGNPLTTKERIAVIKEAGFSSVRVPVTYFNHVDKNGKIDEEWLVRVEEVVNCVLDNDMYCIINIHHDTGNLGWLEADESNVDVMSKKLAGLWIQIAEYFKDYDGRLLFEGFNEILNSNHAWSWAGAGSYEAVNTLNQTFVNTVRSTGGNNAYRHLIANVYATNTDEDILSAYRLPEDTIDNHIIAQVHCYSGDYVNILARVNSILVENGIPVILGEFGTTADMDMEQRITWATEIVTICKDYGIACFWWDDGGTITNAEDVYNYALLNRWTGTWYFEELVDAMVNASK